MFECSWKKWTYVTQLQVLPGVMNRFHITTSLRSEASPVRLRSLDFTYRVSTLCHSPHPPASSFSHLLTSSYVLLLPAIFPFHMFAMLSPDGPQILCICKMRCTFLGWWASTFFNSGDTASGDSELISIEEFGQAMHLSCFIPIAHSVGTPVDSLRQRHGLGPRTEAAWQ